MNTLGWMFRRTVEFFIGHGPADPDYGTYPFAAGNPYKNEADRVARDPVYRLGIIRAPFTGQFWQTGPLTLFGRAILTAFWD